MKNLLTLLFVCVFLNVSAQDLITLKNGSDIKSKVTEINLTEIKYKKFDNLNGPIFTISKEDVLIIRYENGTKDIFSNDTKQAKVNQDTLTTNTSISNSTKPSSKSKKTEIIEDDDFVPFDTKKKNNSEETKINENYNYDNSSTDLCVLAKSDARRYYDTYKGATTGTALTVFLASPILGLIPAIACSSTPPSDYNLNIPNEKLERNSKYYNCYRKEATKIKSRKVWSTFGISTLINTLLVVTLLSL